VCAINYAKTQISFTDTLLTKLDYTQTSRQNRAHNRPLDWQLINRKPSTERIRGTENGCANA